MRRRRASACSSNIPVPLPQHPRHASRAYQYRPRKATPPPHGTEYSPLARKVHERDDIRCERQQIQGPRVSIEGCRQAHEGGDECPGAESAGAEWRDLRAGT